ncbi:hypothetical protein R1sor_010581 [Riccia sorocarpa]|uniref:Uncharacterized protein n=1 Tax=Riccia sorocarpa TaxID=122646 RepID=A0ABD3I219_9MARC
MSTSAVKLFRAADIFKNVTVKKSKAKWFVREALHVFGARSIFLQSSKKDPVNTSFVVHIGQEKDQVDVLVQNEKELVCYELLLKNIQIREFSIPLQKVLGLELDPCGAWLARFFCHPMRRMGWHLLANHAPYGLPEYFLATPCDAWGGTSWQAMRRMACSTLSMQAMRRMGCHQSTWFLIDIPSSDLQVDALRVYLVNDPKWKFVERDSVKLALRLGILKPPQGSKAQDMLPHNKEWNSYKAREEARLKAQATQREDPPEEDVEDDPASKIVSPEVDRAKKKRNDGGSQRDSFLSITFSPLQSSRGG